MYSIKINQIIKITVLTISTLLSLTSCSYEKVDEKSKIDISNSEYIVSLSRAREPYSKLVFLNGKGKLIGSYNYSGYSINRVNYFEDKIFLTSNRLNEHYILNKEGNIEKYSNSSDQKDNKYLASWFTEVGEKTLIETVNIGRVNDKYLSQILYSYDNQKKSVTLENQYLNNALDKFGKIFVESYSENDEKNGITIINKDTAKIEKRIDFKNGFTSSSSELIDYNDKIITYGNNELDEYQDNQIQSVIAVLDCNTYEVTQHSFYKEKIIYSYIYNNKIYVITDINSVYEFNDKLELLEKKSILDKTFINNWSSNDYSVRKIIHDDKVISVLYTSKKFDVEDLGFIVEYNCDDIVPLKQIYIVLKKEKVWVGEVVDFIKLK